MKFEFLRHISKSKQFTFVCFILRFRFPLCPRPPGPIGTPLYRTNCLRVLASWSPNCKLGALSQPYVVFMGIDTHGLGGPVHNTDNSHSFTNLSKDVWYRTELQLKCNPAWNILFAKPLRNLWRRTVPEIPIEMQQLRTISRLILKLDRGLAGATSRSWCSSIEIS